MNRGPKNDDAFDSDESSGVTTTMAAVPAKTLRLSELEEADRTAYFSVSALLERGKAVAARSAPPPGPAPAPTESVPPPAAPLPTELPQLTYVTPDAASPAKKPGPWQQLREASLAKKAIMVLLPLLMAVLALEPTLEKQETAAAASSVQHAPVVPREVTEQEPEQMLAPSPAEPPPALPKGVSLERAATDALSAGDFQRALASYRELSRREPTNAAYREAARILERRSKVKPP